MVKPLDFACFYPLTGGVCFVDEPLLADGRQAHVHSAGHPGASVNCEMSIIPNEVLSR